MGLNASSDKWCCKSDVIIEGLPWARKLVDDTIIWADNEEDLVIRTQNGIGEMQNEPHQHLTEAI